MALKEAESVSLASDKNTFKEMFAHYLDAEAHIDVLHELYKTWNHTNK